MIGDAAEISLIGSIADGVRYVDAHPADRVVMRAIANQMDRRIRET